MHLYLSSYLIGDRGHQLADLARDKTALLVSNALDFSDDSERLKSGREREVRRLADLGVPAEPLDLHDHFESESMEAVVDYTLEHDLPYRAISDGEVILDTTHHRELVGGGNPIP